MIFAVLNNGISTGISFFYFSGDSFPGDYHDAFNGEVCLRGDLRTSLIGAGTSTDSSLYMMSSSDSTTFMAPRLPTVLLGVICLHGEIYS